MEHDQLDDLIKRGGTYFLTHEGRSYALYVVPVFGIVDQTLRLMGLTGKWTLQLLEVVDVDERFHYETRLEEKELSHEALEGRVRHMATHLEEALMEDIL